MKIVNKLFFLVFLGLNISSVFAVALGPDQIIQEIIDHTIDGKKMDGMQVTVNGTSNAVWNGTSAGDSGWKLEYQGTDTIAGRWKFTNIGVDPINTVMLDAFGANAVFDWEFVFGSEGTEKSAGGDFKVHAPDPTPNHEFSGPVKIAGSASPVGDLVRWLTFDFANISGLSQNEFIEFTIDSDEFAPIPLPSAVILLFSGLLGLVGLRNRR